MIKLIHEALVTLRTAALAKRAQSILEQSGSFQEGLRRSQKELTSLPRTTKGVLHRALRRTNRRLASAKCLARSIAGKMILENSGLHCEIVVGTRKADGRVELHSWIECEGEPIGENRSEIETYDRIDSADKMFDSLS